MLKKHGLNGSHRVRETQQGKKTFFFLLASQTASPGVLPFPDFRDLEFSLDNWFLKRSFGPAERPRGSRRCLWGGARPPPVGAAPKRRDEASCQSAERRLLICCRVASRGSGLSVYKGWRSRRPPPFCPVRKRGAGVSLRVESATNLARAPFARPPS